MCHLIVLFHTQLWPVLRSKDGQPVMLCSLVERGACLRGTVGAQAMILQHSLFTRCGIDICSATSSGNSLTLMKLRTSPVNEFSNCIVSDGISSGLCWTGWKTFSMRGRGQLCNCWSFVGDGCILCGMGLRARGLRVDHASFAVFQTWCHLFHFMPFCVQMIVL